MFNRTFISMVAPKKYFEELIDKKFNKTEYLKANLTWDETFEVSVKFSKPLEFSVQEKRFDFAFETLLESAYNTYQKLYADYDLFQPKFVVSDTGCISIKVAVKKKKKEAEAQSKYISGWKSIETAPRDGTIILAYGDENLDLFIPYIARYWKGGITPGGYNLLESWQLVNIFGDMPCDWDIEPTHWMEIPNR